MSHFDPKNYPPGLPEEALKHYERAQMTYEANMTEVNNFIGGLDPGQLFTLSKMLGGMTDQEDGYANAQRWLGMTFGALQFVHNRCTICGLDHEGDLLGDHAPGTVRPTTSITKTVDESFDPYNPDDEDDSHLTEPPPEDTTPIDRAYHYPDGVEPFLTQEQTSLMVEYHLDDAWSQLEDGSIRFIGFACTGTTGGACGYIYPSISDRMHKPADTCPGCQQKSRWG